MLIVTNVSPLQRATKSRIRRRYAGIKKFEGVGEGSFTDGDEISFVSTTCSSNLSSFDVKLKSLLYLRMKKSSGECRECV